MDERETMKEIYSYYRVLSDLTKLREDSRITSTMKDQIQILEQELQFLVIYTVISKPFEGRTQPKGKYLSFAESSRIKATLKKKGLLQIGVLAMEKGEFKDWETATSELLDEINSFKPPIREDCSFFSDGLLNLNGPMFRSNIVLEFMCCTNATMANVLHLRGHEMMMPEEKMKFEYLKEKLNVFKIVFNYVKETNSNYSDFKRDLNAWAWNAANLCLLYWVLDENMASKGNIMLYKMYRNIGFSHLEVTKFCLNDPENIEIQVEECCKVGQGTTLKLTRTCLSYLMTTKPSQDKLPEAYEVFLGFIESIHLNLRAYLPKDAIEIMHDAMSFLTAFVMDPLSEQTKAGRSILSEAREILKDVGTLIISLGSGDKDDAGIVQATNFFFHDFIEMVTTIKAKVRNTYPLIFLDPAFNFPRFNVLNSLDASIEKLKEFSFPFSKHPIHTLEKGLVVLRDLLKASNLKDHFVLELQKEPLGSKDLWTRIANVAHKVDRIVRSNTYKDGVGLDIFFLLEFQEEIKCILPKVKMIKNKHIQESYTSRIELNSTGIAPLKSNVQEIDELVVGFDGKVKEIRDWLTCGTRELDIISIYGMGGLGKTTLAKKVYNDPSIKRHFTTFAWCTVSQSFDNKRLLLDILKDVTVINDSFFEMEEEDLSDELRKCLSGQKYLIVMDDMWNVDAWNALRLSFPENGNYSRVMFTSRIHNVVLGAKFNSHLYPLSQLSEQESWELLERRLFQGKDICPVNFVEYGKKIAVGCKGLPLAIVLVGGLLKKEIDNLDWWKQIRESLDSRLSKGGCAHILELSYIHLSEPLKACFLYLGLFPEDKVIQVHKLINLWVSEGFIQEKNMKDVECVANEFILDLISRSLLIVSNKSSRGGIKACRIHDLLREFCLAKSEEEHFFKLLHEKNVSHYTMDENYRISIQTHHLKHFFVRKSSPLHSIHISGIGTSSPCNISPNSFCNAKFLHVLDLEDVRFVDDFPEEITTLFLLRYLAIQCNTKFIPATIARLQKLQTLRIIGKDSFVFPAKILQMESLRHVYFVNVFLQPLLGTIPPMKNIRSFSGLTITQGKEVVYFLRKFITIQKLKCRCRFFDKKTAVNLDFLNRLESLNLINDSYPPRPNFGFILPASIKKLTLSKFYLPWSELSRIAELQNLEILKLLVNAFRGEFCNMEAQEFKRLKYLKFQSLNVKKWTATDENFPSLEEVVVVQCHTLEEIPIEFADISSLRNIHIQRCRSSVVKSAKEIEYKQIEVGSLNFKVEAVQIFPDKFF